MAVVIGRSARNYQERKGHENADTRRGPGPVWDPLQNAARSIQLTTPLPLPDLQHEVSGQDPPDGPLTQVWPHGGT